MSEAGDYSPSGWAGSHDFTKTKAVYRDYAYKSYSKAVRSGKTLKDLVPVFIETDSKNPIIVVTDETGSMGDWPATIFSKLPYLEHEAKTEYFGKDAEFAFGAFGDAHNGEDYPLQIRPFAKGEDLPKKLKELVQEGKGGGTEQESPEYAALYVARNIKMSKAINPLVVFISDESPYTHVDVDLAESLAHVKLEKRMKTGDVFNELKTKAAVYFIQKPYNTGTFSDGELTGVTKRVHEDWAKLVGEDHIALLADPNRVVDVIFGIMAKEAGRIDYFRDEIEDRQKKDQVETVYEALRSIHALPKNDRKLLMGRSVTRKSGKGGKDEDTEPLA